ncbi:hypothetical protein [Atlantibacter hermannii]|uniref:hypothetical protein n=2 Tax=Atlantibacter hermannii TaxID=565 RepID=UPI0028AA0487|nr:hypothetical protein [Atlantibacter hermannii]
MKKKENPARDLVAEIFEKELKKILKNISANFDTLHILGEYAEFMYRNDHFNEGEHIRTANELILPLLLKNYNPNAVSNEKYSYEDYLSICNFLRDFLTLRDTIFYSHADNEAVTWSIDEKYIKVVINDDSILRQYASEMMSFTLNSRNLPYDEVDADPVKLLKGTTHFNFDDMNVARAFSTIESIVDWKMNFYFSYIPENSDIMLDGYKYSLFIDIYKKILTLALYERYFSKANNLSGVITYREDELLEQAILQHPEENHMTLKKIFRDIAESSRSTFNYIPTENKFMLYPTCFSLVDGVSNMLKHFAKTDPNSFSSNVSEIMGKGLVNKVKLKFEQYPNHKLYSNVKLDNFDPKLPDIDLLVISYEPSLGFHVFIGEVKNNLPAVWGKDYLKATGEKGFITKAISQIETIKSFLNTDNGLMFIYNLAIEAFPNLKLNLIFPHGICIIVDTLIISSQSVGMFFPENTIPIMNGDILCHIIDESDGDTNYILFHLKKHSNFINECTSRKTKAITIGDYTIEHDIITLKKIYALSKNKFVSVGAIEMIEKESLDSGYTMAGALRHLGNKDYYMDIENRPQNMSIFVIH